MRTCNQIVDVTFVLGGFFCLSKFLRNLWLQQWCTLAIQMLNLDLCREAFSACVSYYAIHDSSICVVCSCNTIVGIIFVLDGFHTIYSIAFPNGTRWIWFMEGSTNYDHLTQQWQCYTILQESRGTYNYLLWLFVSKLDTSWFHTIVKNSQCIQEIGLIEIIILV